MQNLKDRKLRPELHGYNVFDELGGFDEHGIPKEKAVLSKYDEEIGGSERKAFVIGEYLRKARWFYVSRIQSFLLIIYYNITFYTCFFF